MSCPVSLTHAQRVKRYGSFTFKASPGGDSPERITVDPAWVSKHIVAVAVPQLGGRKVHVHRDVAQPLLALFAAWEDAGVLSDVTKFAGCWVARFKRGKAGGTEKDLSNHSWGSAIDVNPQQNWLGKTPAAEGEPGSVLRLVPIAEANGWAWGGRWKTPDGMHFEYVG